MKCEVWSVKGEVLSVECGVGAKCEMECEVWSVKCGVWSVKCGVESVKCEGWSVWSVEFEV